MYFPDLTPYTYSGPWGSPPALNVGWLDEAHEFTRGTVPPGFVERLRHLARTTPYGSWDYEICPFCPGLRETFKQRKLEPGFQDACFADGRISSKEIRVQGADGLLYISPAMIMHYVEAHGYLPPPGFIAAVMQVELPPPPGPPPPALPLLRRLPED